MYIVHVYAIKKRILQVQIIEKQTKMAASMEHEKKENKVIKSVPKQSNEKRLIVVLERASLESVKVCNVYEILFRLTIKTENDKVRIISM